MDAGLPHLGSAGGRGTCKSRLPPADLSRAAAAGRDQSSVAKEDRLHSLGPVSVLVVGGYLVIRGQTEVSTLVVFISGFNRISDPWAELVAFYRSVSHAHVIYDLVRSALSERPRPFEENMPVNAR